ncbi:MAG: extracellular solute-binding protein, partial [Bacteroidia bacterium]|nr:extracellular solute-binding protein [Bacteroidia bacterium]
ILIPKPDKQGSQTSWSGGEYLVINKSTKYPEEATAFIKFLISKDSALYFAQSIGMLSPAAREAINDSYYQYQPERKKILEQLALSQGSPAHIQWMYMVDILDNYFALAIEGKKNVSSALNDAKKEIDEYLQILR